MNPAPILKAGPAQVAADIHNVRSEDHTWLFQREEWLSKNQVQGFCSRLATKRRRHTNEEISLEDALEGEQEQEQNNLLNAIDEDLDLISILLFTTSFVCVIT